MAASSNRAGRPGSSATLLGGNARLKGKEGKRGKRKDPGHPTGVRGRRAADSGQCTYARPRRTWSARVMVISMMSVRRRMTVILAWKMRKGRACRRTWMAQGRHLGTTNPGAGHRGWLSDRAAGAGYLLARFAALAAFFSFFEEAGAFLPSRWVCFSLTMVCSLSAGCWFFVRQGSGLAMAASFVCRRHARCAARGHGPAARRRDPHPRRTRAAPRVPRLPPCAARHGP